jgi:pimeloyl-ACP methyl ester carboxylesterase
LIGHSLGGYLSTQYALRYPDRIQKLILMSPAGYPVRKYFKMKAVFSEASGIKSSWVMDKLI